VEGTAKLKDKIAIPGQKAGIKSKQIDQ